MISIAMTTYNGEKYIKEQLLSILNQTLLPDEIIICDDGSTDRTVEIIYQVIEQLRGQISVQVVVNKENLGYIRNFYNAIKRTKGDYIFLADQDDVWHEDKLKSMIDGMNKYSCSAMCSNFSLIDENGQAINDRANYRIHPFVKKARREYEPISFYRLVFGNIVQGCTYCFTKEVKELYLKLNHKELIHDHQIMFVATLIGDVYFYNKKLIDYRIHTSNAIGFQKKTSKVDLGIKKPSKQPFMVRFINELDAVHNVPFKWYYIILYYLRIPHFVSKLRKS